MKISYIRERKDLSKGQQVVTIVSEYVKDANEILIAIAVCSKNDQFYKKDGIYIARRRFEKLLNVKDKPAETFECDILHSGDIDYSKFARRVKYIGPETYNRISHAVKLTVISMIWEDKRNSFDVKS